MNTATLLIKSSTPLTPRDRFRVAAFGLGIGFLTIATGCGHQPVSAAAPALNPTTSFDSDVSSPAHSDDPPDQTKQTKSFDLDDQVANDQVEGIRRGRGPGNMAGIRGDMTTLHSMFTARNLIKRTVRTLSNGAEATTESEDKTIAGLIQEHVPAMESRVLEKDPLPPMTIHPIFVELIKRAEDYELHYEETDKGIKVTYVAEDPHVIMLVQEHAQLVSRFLKNGMQEIHKPYTLPKVAEIDEEAGQSGLVLAKTDVPFTELWRPLPEIAESPKDNPSTLAKIELGKKLFFDPRLSLTGTVSCNSCHNIMEGGDDGRPTSMGIRGLTGPRNAPTVWNSAFQASQFWDGRSPSLEDQAGGPIVAGPEMGMPAHSHAIERIALVPGYKAEFRNVFGDGDVIKIENTVKAIAAFERTLVTPNSLFDRFLKGEKAALTNQQIRGMELFDSVGCSECHSGTAFNNWFPGDEPDFLEFPRYPESSYVLRYKLMADRGRGDVTNDDADNHSFKVPTLRNITLTAPYFHNGSVSTLSESIRVMADTQLDTKLSKTEVADIMSFLTSLEGTFPEIVLPRIPSRTGATLINEHEVESSSTANQTSP